MIELFCFVSGTLRLGPFGLYDDGAPRLNNTTPFPSETSTSLFKDSSTPDSQIFEGTTLPLRIVASLEKTSWGYFKENFLPILSLLSYISTFSYFAFKTWRLVRLHWKYRRFRFIRRTPAERAAVQTNDAIVQMDPLRPTSIV